MMCGYCWGHSYVEGTGKALPNSATFVITSSPNSEPKHER